MEPGGRSYYQRKFRVGLWSRYRTTLVRFFCRFLLVIVKIDLSISFTRFLYFQPY